MSDNRRAKAAFEARTQAPERPAWPWTPDERIEVRIGDLVALVNHIAYRHRSQETQEALIRVGRQIGKQGGINFEAVTKNSWRRKPCDYPGCDQPVPLDHGRCQICRSTYPLPVGESEIRTCVQCPGVFYGSTDLCPICVEADYREERRGA